VNNAGCLCSFKQVHVAKEAWQKAITLNFCRPRQMDDQLIDHMAERKQGRISGSRARASPST
jgi:3-oxoacyl-[acyl-carrier protein] reductase